MSSIRKIARTVAVLVVTLYVALLAPVGPTAEAGEFELVKTDQDRTLSAQAGTIQFEASEFLVVDGFWQAEVRITRTGGSTGEIGFGVHTTDGTAVAGVDYQAWDSPTGNLKFKDGIAQTNTLIIQVEGRQDLPQPDRSFMVHLTTLDPTHLGAQSSTTVTIRDFDGPTDPGFVDSRFLLAGLNSDTDTEVASSKGDAPQFEFTTAQPVKSHKNVIARS